MPRGGRRFACGARLVRGDRSSAGPTSATRGGGFVRSTDGPVASVSGSCRITVIILWIPSGHPDGIVGAHGWFQQRTVHFSVPFSGALRGPVRATIWPYSIVLQT